jgi:hypothetical protein
MAKSILMKIMPQLSSSELNKMQRQLNTSFSRIGKMFNTGLLKSAKLFGGRLTSGMKGAVNLFNKSFKAAGSGAKQGLKAAIGGGLFGFGMKLVDAAKEQFQIASDALDKHLKKADNLQTLASSLGASASDTLQLLQAGELANVDQDAMQKFLLKMVELRSQEMQEAGSTGLQAVHMEGNALEAFEANLRGLNEKYLQGEALKKEGKVKEGAALQEEVTAEFNDLYGMRLAGRSLELFMSNIDELKKQTAAAQYSDKRINRVAKEGGDLEFKQVKARQKIETENFIAQGDKVSGATVDKQMEIERLKEKKATDLLGYEAFKRAADAYKGIEEIMQLAANGMNQLLQFIPTIIDAFKNFHKVLDTIADKLENIPLVGDEIAAQIRKAAEALR